MEFKDLEYKMAQMRLYESNHLLSKYNDKIFKGWYIYGIQNEIDGEIFDNIFVRFRLPPTIPIYQGLIRNFSEEERILGIHRMLIGKDLKEDAEKMAQHKTIDEYINHLTEEEIKNFTERLKYIVTFDCNKIPYLWVVEKSVLRVDHEEKIKNFVKNHPDYLDIFVKVLNNKITIQEATTQSNGVIYSEFLDI